MIKFDVFNRFSGDVQFTAEIGVSDSAHWGRKRGLAVKWAVRTGANLVGTNLVGADLSGANLVGTNLVGADLSGANLSGADIEGANLSGVNLSGANLVGADLNGANLSGADIEGANLVGVSGINDYVKCIQIDGYPITYTNTILQIGCQRHEINEWADFDDHRIAEMDGKSALKFWRKYKAWIFQTIELCPAKPTEGAT